MIIDRTEQVKREIRDRARRGMTVAGNVATAAAVEKAPINMGNLRDGIFAKPVEEHGSELRLTIVDSVEYARFQEMGAQAAPGKFMRWKDLKTGEYIFAKKIKATPHMRPMVDHMRTVFQSIIERAVFGK